MPKDKSSRPDPEGLKPLPKPIQLNLPSQRSKPLRRLHEPDPDHTQSADAPKRDTPKHDVPKRDTPKHNAPKQENKPTHPPPIQTRPTGKRYFMSAQKAYGQRRPRQPKPLKPMRPSKRQDTTGPRLGQGDRLFTPPTPKKQMLPLRVKRVLKFWSVAVIFIALFVFGLINLFGNNAWAVYLGDNFLGYMPINREVEPISVHHDAVSHLAGFVGAEVEVNEVATVRMARARRRELYTASDMTIKISRNFTYQIFAAGIYIDGERVAVMRNASDAEHVAAELKRPFITGYNITAAFEEDWQVRRIMADIYDMDSPDDVIQLLERPFRDVRPHIIRSGDTQGGLAIEFNTTIERIGYLNNISADVILRVGETLLLEVTRPRLTVRTIDEFSDIEEIPMEIETLENSEKHISLTTVIAEGRNGEQEVVKRITRINGVQVGDVEIVSSRVLREAETRIVEVGTSETSIEVR